MFTPELTPEEVSTKLNEGTEAVKSAMLQIGLEATDASVNELLGMSLKDRKEVWDAIFAKMQVGMTSFEQYLEEAEFHTNATPETIAAMKTLHETLNFDADIWLKETCGIEPLIIMKEQAGALSQYRAFEGLKAVARFFRNTSGKVYPRTLYNGTEIIEQDPLTEAELTKWTPINADGMTSYFNVIRAAYFDGKIPDDLDFQDGISEAFGRKQDFIPSQPGMNV